VQPGTLPGARGGPAGTFPVVTDRPAPNLTGDWRVNPWEVIEGDSLTVLRSLPTGLAQTCVTSPPYFSLRDYGTGTWEGGEAGCSHKVRSSEGVARALASSTLGPNRDGVSGQQTNSHQQEGYRSICGKCGAKRVDQQIGLEATPEVYVARLVEVFREVRRVLHPTGTLWLNVGDSYSATGKSGGGKQGERWAECGADHTGPRGGKWSPAPPGYKPKDLLGLPWLLAFALRADGWYLRSEIIWGKPAPMPESVRDRPTRAHEQVFLFSVQPRYFYDQDAERVAATDYIPRTNGRERNVGGRVDGYTTPVGNVATPSGGRNLWSYWTDIAPDPCPEAHFATFPFDLPARCIRLGSSARGQCPRCGAAWVRQTERKRRATRPGNESKVYVPGDNKQDQVGKRTYTGFNQRWREAQEIGNRDPLRHCTDVSTLGWAPSCECPGPPDPIPQLCLDPFAGAGTTLMAARALGRRAVGIELNPTYAALARRRIAEVAPLLDATDRVTTPTPTQRTLFEGLP
jgi:DNA modification methylase